MNCDKSYNEISIVMTHNSYNCASAFRLPNQNLNIKEQLEGGVRGLMLDFHLHKEEIVVMHNYPMLGFQQTDIPLGQIKAFLDEHPKEVVTIIIESHVTAADIENALNKAGLLDYCHVQQKEKEWPTLEAMIQSNKRLVIFSEKNDGLSHQDWYHYAWAYIVDTPYSFHSTSAFKCNANRGQPGNKLLLLNHWITDRMFGAGRAKSAHKTNGYDMLCNRVKETIEQFGRKPTFLGIDFFEKGAPFQIIEELNGDGIN